MKLHDPETECHLLRLAEAGRKGKPMESPDKTEDLMGGSSSP